MRVSLVVVPLISATWVTGCIDQNTAGILQVAANGNVSQSQVAGMAINLAQQAAQEEKARIAREKEEQRVAELKKTAKGRAQLAAEEKEKAANRKANEALVSGFVGALFSGGGSGYSESGRLPGCAVGIEHTGCLR